MTSQAEVLEYIKRDIANLARLNKDNRARNTAMQRDFDGCIALTPLYDVAPMYLHPDGIARRIRREDNDYGRTDRGRVVDRICELGTRVAREPPIAGIKAMEPALRQIDPRTEKRAVRLPFTRRYSSPPARSAR